MVKGTAHASGRSFVGEATPSEVPAYPWFVQVQRRSRGCRARSDRLRGDRHGGRRGGEARGEHSTTPASAIPLTGAARGHRSDRLLTANGDIIRRHRADDSLCGGTKRPAVRPTPTSDLLTAEVVDEIRSCIESSAIKCAIVDLGAVRFLVSANLYPDAEPLTPLVKLHQQLLAESKRLVLCNLRCPVAEVFRVS